MIATLIYHSIHLRIHTACTPYIRLSPGFLAVPLFDLSQGFVVNRKGVAR